MSEIIVPFQTYAGGQYQLEWTEDFVTWTRLPKIYQGDGTIQTEVFPVNQGARRFYRLYGTQPQKGFSVITAWDGSYVLLERTPFAVGDPCNLFRNGQQIASMGPTSLSFKDTGVSSGGRYVYTLQKLN